jgi:hypothetical protein
MEMGKRTGTSIEERILVSKLPSGTTASTSCRRTLYITLVADIDRPSKFGSLVGGKVPSFILHRPPSLPKLCFSGRRDLGGLPHTTPVDITSLSR